jgi:hypothetical protein
MSKGVMQQILDRPQAFSLSLKRKLASLRAYPPGGKIHTFSLAPYLHLLTKS